MKYELTEGAIRVEVKALIALCYIFEDYEKFSEDVRGFFYKNSGKKYNNLVDVSLGKHVFFDDVTKEFYEYNKSIIDKINQHYYISNVLADIMHSNTLGKMYEYFKRNKKNLNIILGVLLKIQNLGFLTVYFNENMDFDKRIFTLSTSFHHNDIYVVDGYISMIPSRDLNTIKYQTKGANYLIELDWEFDKITNYNRNIILNNLVFDVNNLPKTISYQDVIQPLKDMKERNKETDQFIANSVYLDNSLNDIDELIERMGKIVSNISEVGDKEKAKELIVNTEKAVGEMHKFLSAYERKGKKKHSVRQNVLEEEKVKYKTYLRDSAIDLC